MVKDGFPFPDDNPFCIVVDTGTILPPSQIDIFKKPGAGDYNITVTVMEARLVDKLVAELVNELRRLL